MDKQSSAPLRSDVRYTAASQVVNGVDKSPNTRKRHWRWVTLLLCLILMTTTLVLTGFALFFGVKHLLQSRRSAGNDAIDDDRQGLIVHRDPEARLTDCEWERGAAVWFTRRQKCNAFPIRAATNGRYGWPNEDEISNCSLVRGLKPLRYDLSLRVNKSSRRSLRGYEENVVQLDGWLEIVVGVVETTSEIFINVARKTLKLDYSTLSIRRRCDSKRICVKAVHTGIASENGDADAEMDAILLQETLAPGEVYVLKIGQFNTEPTSEGKGGMFYEKNVEEPFFVSTLFQMRHARSVFPCFDHPALKAKLQLCLTHPHTLTAYSNTEATSTLDLAENLRETCFAKTPIMSPYLFTFVLTENFTEIWSRSNTTDILVLHPSLLPSRKFHWMLVKSRQFLEATERLTGATFPLRRLGLANVAQPFVFDAIENYGLISMDNRLSRQYSSGSHRILSHEIIHQWVGNYFTVRSWDDICLQEGLTTYLDWQLSREVFRSHYQYMQNIVAKTMQTAFRWEKYHPRPLVGHFNQTKDIGDMCFMKPPLIFRMVRFLFGGGVIAKFLKELSSNYSFGNPSRADWMRLLSKSAESTLAGEMLDRWFTQAGYPLVTAKAVRNDTRSSLMLNQHWFVGGNRMNDSYRLLARFKPFIFPLNVVTDKETVFSKVENTTTDMPLRSVSPPKWFLINDDHSAYAEIVYDVDNYLALADCALNLSSCPGLTLRKLNDHFSSFCLAFSKDMFPWDTDETEPAVIVAAKLPIGGDVVVKSRTRTKWAQLVEKLSALTDVQKSGGQRRLNMGYECTCCFKTRSEIERRPWDSRTCLLRWNNKCRQLRLMRLLDRTYKIEVHRQPQQKIGDSKRRKTIRRQ